MRGFHFGCGRQPQTSSQVAHREQLASVLQCILADFELVERPTAGCATRVAQPERDNMEQVVLQVIRELEKRGVV